MYRYYGLNRPLTIGTHPDSKENPAIKIHNYDNKIRVGNLCEAWGYVEYKKPLTKREISDYELLDSRCKRYYKVMSRGNIAVIVRTCCLLPEQAQDFMHEDGIKTSYFESEEEANDFIKHVARG